MTNMQTSRILTLFVALMLSLSVSAGWNPNKSAKMDKAAKEAIAEFKKKDPSIKTFFDKAYAYVVFPSVGKGGIGIGGSYGKGAVYRKGKMVGFASLTQGSIGFQFGGQVFRELIFFKDKAAFDRFKSDNVEFSAKASAVAADVGAAATADYSDGVAVFTMAKAGLMYEAAIGGQSFRFTPLK